MRHLGVWLLLLSACGEPDARRTSLPVPAPSATSATAMGAVSEVAVAEVAPSIPVLHAVSAVSASRVGAEVSVTSGRAPLAFDLPPAWLAWNASTPNNIHLSPSELAPVEEATSEWDAAYAAVANAVFPFEACVLHAGGEGWGREAAGYGDVQLRVYLVVEPPPDVLRRAHELGPAALRGAGATAVTDVTDPSMPFARALVQGTVWYGDYGGEASIDLRVQRRRYDTLVFVFMYSSASDPQPVIDLVLGSVRP